MNTFYTLPIRTVSEANISEHWGSRSRRASEQRLVARVITAHRISNAALPMTITMKRIGPKRMDDDNLARSLKAVRDGIADALGADDGDPRLTWRYEQDSQGFAEYSVIVFIEEHGRSA